MPLRAALRYAPGMATERLHLTDSSLDASAGRVVRATEHQRRPSIVLDRSCFFAEGGGQLGDRGVIELGDRALTVTDTQIDEEGWVHHLVAGEIGPADEGREARARIDRPWRRDMMSQHTGQHLLSRALLDVAGGETVSARLGASLSTIDISLPALDGEAIEAVERHVNEAILDDRLIRVHFPSPAELAAMKLRREPKVEANVRVVEVEGYDLSPCGGTHCARTGQVGPVVVTGVERYKGMTRVSFLAGARSLAEQRQHRQILGELARSFSSGIGDVSLHVWKLRTDLRERVDQLGTARGELVALLAEAQLAASPPAEGGATRVVVERPDGDLPLARALASRLARRPDVVALVATRESPEADLQVVVERGPGAAFDCGAWLKATAARHGGRGGGRPDRAEGRLPGHLDWSLVSREG